MLDMRFSQQWGYEEFYFLGYNAMQSGVSLLMFCRNMLLHRDWALLHADFPLSLLFSPDSESSMCPQI
jgi:hypothetical protein